jgi:hypothetical protein
MKEKGSETEVWAPVEEIQEKTRSGALTDDIVADG